ncbi:MAG: hypothetical protein M1450_03730 [Patescibacteria group bacterium]|nr:hypothetical protein [Patescibacteria group bacterium]
MASDERHEFTGVDFSVSGEELQKGPTVQIKSEHARGAIPQSLQAEGADGVIRTYPSVMRRALEVIGKGKR